MKVRVDCDAMLEAFQAVASVCPLRSPKLELLSVKFEATADGASLSATNLEVGVRRNLSGVEVDEPGSVLLSKERFGQILNLCGKGSQIRIDASPDQILIRSGGARWSLNAEDPAKFPTVPEFPDGPCFVASAEEYREASRRATSATDDKAGGSNYAFHGVLHEFREEGFALVGMDGRKLAIQPIALTTPNGEPPHPEAPVIPAKALKIVERNLDGEDYVSIAFDKNRAVLFKTDSAVLYARLAEGRIPAFRAYLPKSFQVEVQIPAKELLLAVGRAAVCTSEESRAVGMEFGGGRLTLAAIAPERGASDVEVPVAYDGPAVDVAFDNRHLGGWLGLVPADEPVTVKVADSTTPVVLSLADGGEYVVYPITKAKPQ